jgi:hypothetical protein
MSTNPNDQNPNNQAPANPNPGNQYPGNSYPNNQYPANPYPNNQYPYNPYPYNMYQPIMQPVQQDCGAATVSLVFGILAYFLLPGIGALVAIICGHVGIAQIKESNGAMKGKGLAIAGLVMGYVQIACIAIFALILILASTAGTSYFNNMYY